MSTDKSEAMEALSQLLNKIPQLKELRHGNPKYTAWYYEVCDTLESIFGRDSIEYKRFTVKIRSYKRGASEAEKQERYVKQLDEQETDLRSIVKRQEIKKTVDSTMEAVSTAPKAFVSNDGEKHPFEEGWEIELQGDNLSRLHPLITMVANELRFRNCYFEARLANSKATDDYNWFDVFVTDPTTIGSKIPIGAFTLQLLGNNRIVLRVPPRSRWHHDGGLTGGEIIRMGLTAKDEEESRFTHECFSKFIKSLEDRLAHYSLKVTWYKRLWRGFKELIGVAKAVKP